MVTKGKRKKKAPKKRKVRGSEDTRARRKFARGGRVEAYTMGETQKKRKDPIWG